MLTHYSRPGSMDYPGTTIAGRWVVSSSFSTKVEITRPISLLPAYVVWTHLGFYPVAGQDTYLLNRPFFPSITIRNEVTDAVATITAANFGDENKYIQSAKLNGQEYTKNWISHELFEKGGTLEFVMGPGQGSSWGTGKGDLPPSLSTFHK